MSLFAEACEAQARACDGLGSPFTARLMRVVAERLAPGTALADRLLGWGDAVALRDDAVPLRLAGALQALVLSGRAPGLAAVYPPHAASGADLWAAVSAALGDHAGVVDAMLDSPPQTNEVARSAVLIAAAHWLDARLGLPLVVSELGASAGLNLNFDRYRLELGGQGYVPGDAVLTLAPEARGGRPPVAAPRVAERRGVDLRPVDLSDPAARLRLRSYVWADQSARIDRLERALTLPPAPVDAGDAADWLAARLAGRHPGHLHLVYHTIAWQYFPQPVRAACTAALAVAGAAATDDAPLAHLAMEADDTGQPGAGLAVTLWPGGATIALGRADFHGRWLDWTAPDPS